MNTTLALSEKERSAHTFTEANLHDPHQIPKFFLVVCCLSTSFNPKTFIKRMGDFWSNKYRVQFWVQTHRLLFLSKSRALTKKVGEWVGGYIDVHEDSLHESWGPFIGIHVWIDVNQPLMRGKMVNLLKILELIDNGVDPDLPYGLKMMGDKLPNSGYDRYQFDFSKANAYPFLTRLSKKAIGQAIPPLISNKHLAIGTIPHPPPLTNTESSSTNSTNRDGNYTRRYGG
uniref:DUF4283 domain-containing protein n=1 Tax=Cannabis sativa TaxID=3483 RepID=A0A803PMH6_CANSA